MDDNCDLPNLIKFIVGNKSDVERAERRVEMKRGKEFADRHRLEFFETSALLNDGSLNMLFQKIAQSIKENFTES